jgi:hypothetical protein
MIAAMALLVVSAHASERRRIVLKEAWYVKQLETDKPVMADLIEGLGNHNDGWMTATISAQVHDVLLAHGRIADPHVGKNAAACASVGEKEWVYVCRFATPQEITGPVLYVLKGSTRWRMPISTVSPSVISRTCFASMPSR